MYQQYPPDLSNLEPDALTLARDAAETALRFRDYLPEDGILVTLLGKFRDDTRDVLQQEQLARPYRGRDVKTLDELTSVELDTLSGSVGILVDRFVPYMDDPDLAHHLIILRDLIIDQKAERTTIRASIGTS